MHAVVKTERGRPRVLQVGLRNILNPVEGAVLVPALDHTQAPISEEVVPGEGQGEVMVNGKFLLQALEECKEERVHLHLHPGPKSPLLEIKEAGFYALMAGLKTATPQNPS